LIATTAVVSSGVMFTFAAMTSPVQHFAKSTLQKTLVIWCYPLHLNMHSPNKLFLNKLFSFIYAIFPDVGQAQHCVISYCHLKMINYN
jgi:hypothetical protein